MDKELETRPDVEDEANAPAQDIDLKNMSIDDMRKVGNPVLRQVLLEAKEHLQQEMMATYVSHNQHNNHSNSADIRRK